MRNRRGLSFILIGVLLIAAAASLGVYNVWDEKRAADAAESTVEELLPMIPDLEKLNMERPEPVDPSEVVIPDYILNPKMDMPTAQVAEYDYVGVLSVPSLGLKLPVMSDWSYPLLKVSPCRFSGSPYQNDLVIAAHNYRRHFGRLTELQQGDAVDFTDMDGNVFHYEVGEMEVLEPNEGRKMVGSDWDLTLFTCTIGGRARFTVRCAQINDQ